MTNLVLIICFGLVCVWILISGYHHGSVYERVSDLENVVFDEELEENE